jgi:hypothetical protein
MLQQSQTSSDAVGDGTTTIHFKVTESSRCVHILTLDCPLPLSAVHSKKPRRFGRTTVLSFSILVLPTKGSTG